MKKSHIEEILSRVQKRAASTATPVAVRDVLPTRAEPMSSSMDDMDDDEEYVPVGTKGLLAASQKLLAVNRGLDQPDDRDSLMFKRFLTTDKLLSERIKLDAEGIRRGMLPLVARHRNLKALGPFVFDNYTEKFLIGNSLSSPLEEINPLHLLEQSRRATQMGPGGIGTEQAITEDMQCHDEQTEVFTSTGWKPWPAVTQEDLLACRIEGRLEYHKPSALTKQYYEGVMYGVKSRSVNFLVTPNHRFFTASSARTKNWSWELAEEHFGKSRVYQSESSPYKGSNNNDTFELPAVEFSVNGDKHVVPPILNMGDWCEFLGWFMAEGCTYGGKAIKRYEVIITQSLKANEAKVNRIALLLNRLPFNFKYFEVNNNFIAFSKVLYKYLSPYGKCGVKYVPDFLFEVKPEYRRRFLDAFALGDGHRTTSGNTLYSSSSEVLARGIERLLVSLGRSTSLGKPWRAYNEHGIQTCWMYRANELTCGVKEIKSNNHYQTDYKGFVYCATVPGSLLLTRRGGSAFWNGNSIKTDQYGFISPIEGPESEKIGIDTRCAWGSRIGSDGKLYQKFFDRRLKKIKWLSAEDLDGLTVKLPD